MDIVSFIEVYKKGAIISEQDVRTKVSTPLIEGLGYTSEYRAEEFPVYAYEGRTPIKTKYVDTMAFNEPGFEKHRSNAERNWVMEHSLIAIEIKKPDVEISIAQGQAQFYGMWTRCLYYICTNGIQIAIYKIENHTIDYEICNCDIQDLTLKWSEIEFQLSRSRLNEQKSQNIKKTDIYFEYCLSVIQQSDTRCNWAYIPQLRNSDNKEESISFDEVYLKKSQIIMLADAGMGKTCIFQKMAAHIAKEYCAKGHGLVPIIIAAKFWGRSFSVIEEEIVRTIQPYIPSITIDTVKNEIRNGEYFLFIDGLDECFVNRDMLVLKLQTIAKTSNCHIAISCRPSLYVNQFEGFSVFLVPELIEADIIKIVSAATGADQSMTINGIEDGLKKILKKPLYLYMWLVFFKQQENKKNTLDNKAMLFDKFCFYQLNELLENKGNQDYQLIPYSSILNILACFAFYSIENSSKFDFVDAVKKVFDDTVNIEKVTRICIQSGILYRVDGFLDFQLYSMKEYFCAYYLKQLRKDDALEFLQIHINDEHFNEVIYLWMGLLHNTEAQNFVLDYIETTNLTMYVKCLYRRYNFSKKYLESLSKQQCETFFNQILETYSNLVNRFFSNIKKYFGPWSCSNEKHEVMSKQNIVLQCSIDINTLDVNIELIIADLGCESRISLEYKNNTPKIQIFQDGKTQEIKISALTDKCAHFYYNLNETYGGIDCSREIAVRMIEDNLRRLLESDFLSFYEPTWMKIENLEYMLSKLPKTIDIECEREVSKKLSLRTFSLERIESIFAKNIDYVYTYNKGVQMGVIAAPMIVLFARDGIKAGLDPEEVLPPLPDKTPKDNTRSCFVKDLYTHETYIKWISTFYRELRNQYCLFVESVFPNIKNELQMYCASPFQYHIEVYFYDDGEHIPSPGFIELEIEPKDDISICDPTITVHENCKGRVGKHNIDYFKEHREKIMKLIMFLGRKDNSYYHSLFSGEMPEIYGSEAGIRKKVYKTLVADFDKIFKKN